MTEVWLSQSTQDKINIALAQGPGANNANYVAAYSAIYNDIKNTGVNAGTLNWFSMAGDVNGQQYNPTAAGAYNGRPLLFERPGVLRSQTQRRRYTNALATGQAG